MDHGAIALAACAAILFGAGTAGAAFGADQAKRTILNQIDIAGTDRIAEIGIGEATSGASIGLHSHPGEELGYVLSGTAVLKVPGKPDREIRAGDTYTLPTGTVHNVVSVGGTSRVLVVWIVDKSKPLSTPAPK